MSRYQETAGGMAADTLIIVHFILRLHTKTQVTSLPLRQVNAFSERVLLSNGPLFADSGGMLCPLIALREMDQGR